MKLPILLSVQFLSASPAFAGDFVYLECRGTVVTVMKELNSSRMKREEADEMQHYKVDLANSRMMTVSNPEWEDVEIVNGEVVMERELTSNGYTATIKSSMQIIPAGRMTAESFARSETISQLYTAKGMCKAIDASVFEKVLEARS